MQKRKPKTPGFFYCVGVMLGRDTYKTPKAIIPEKVKKIYASKPQGAEVIAAMEQHQAHGKTSSKWLKRRWTFLIFINLLFLLSYKFDVQLLEGALTASRFFGFHMADLNSALQITLASKKIVLNLVIGVSTVFVLWFIFGGRSFCSWVCPYHFFSELAEKIHLKLSAKGLITDNSFNRKARLVFYLLFALSALVTGYTIFEVISPTGIVSRAIIYGPTLALLWVLFILMVEIFYSRRAWCRYVCPIGLTYGFVGIFSPLKVNYNITSCFHEGDCRKICLVPHVLEWTIKNRATKVNTLLGPDCTRCGMCVDICPTDSLRFVFQGLSKVESGAASYDKN